MACEPIRPPGRPAPQDANVRVGLELTDEMLLIDVTGDGPGDEPNNEWMPGSGTESMRERSEQPGGHVHGGPDTSRRTGASEDPRSLMKERTYWAPRSDGHETAQSDARRASMKSGAPDSDGGCVMAV